jgi:hypothetical protein
MDFSPDKQQNKHFYNNMLFQIHPVIDRENLFDFDRSFYYVINDFPEKAFNACPSR